MPARPTPPDDSAAEVSTEVPAREPAAGDPADALAHAEHTNYRQAQADYRPIKEETSEE